MNRFPRAITFAVGSITMLIFMGMSLSRLENYIRLEDLLRFRHASNMSNGAGLVFNPNERILTTLSPLTALLDTLFLLPVGIAVEPIPALAVRIVLAITTALALGGVGAHLYTLQNKQLSLWAALVSVAVFIASQPAWINVNNSAPLAVFWILAALQQGEQGRWTIAGGLAGLGIVSAPVGIAGAIALGIYAVRSENGLHFWRWVLIPLGLWLAFAAFYYDGHLLEGLLVQQIATEGDDVQNMLWIALFTVLCLVASRIETPQWAWLFAGWAVLEIGAKTLIYNDLMQVDSLPLALFIAISIPHIVKQLTPQPTLAFAAVPMLAALFTVFPLQNSDSVQFDVTLSNTIYIDRNNDLMHDRSTALLYFLDDFTGNSYAWHGDHSALVEDYINRSDYESLIVQTAPQFIYLNDATLQAAGVNLRSETLRALNYQREIDVQLDPGQREGDGFWFRNNDVGEFGDVMDIDKRLTPDITLTGYATDRTRIVPGEPYRLRLDWQLERPAEDVIGLQLNLLDRNGVPLSSLFPSYAADAWQADHFSTYHAFDVAHDTAPQLVTIQVAIDYRAAIIGQASITQTSVQPPVVRVPETPVGQIASVTLHEAHVIPIDDRLDISLLWETDAVLAQDYQVLMHLVPVGDVQPVATGDSAPLSGAYPTSIWRPGDVIADRYSVSLADIPPGEYQLNTGFYLLETFERLRDENGDSLTIASIIIEEDGSLKIRLPAP